MICNCSFNVHLFSRLSSPLRHTVSIMAVASHHLHLDTFIPSFPFWRASALGRHCLSAVLGNTTPQRPKWYVIVWYVWLLVIIMTSSSAVVKRPRDASCLSVVSFNSTKRRVESFIVSYVDYRFVTACS